ncbi:MAG: HAMP domain-containing histidine kinase [Candidatus Thiodiazotropha sp. (ex Lucinoma annulata)]|nr:HAMP domain-containing histidine kinase [Candidatus Thiodiazotropha sp. (ex Lucinoma borealis)]MCU7840253.1 HAMP domain-containing histidine kinase [Candidatus Thiodiazotropha sp. (ex Troendleina suluensis)]MCU7863963.1 HAMP domain-containing histidine kinase [Candidatus Thiodiazotropha sp. (ex Lucinoma borealis)]MCU7867183.1 HAMP domain-containing histidine kinase [Candidatus Thiodiazotropha sp. (ex Lucinoma borealis)]MCU7883952.1 HAMP domain-containing histidine kinase [Candidatus Thiodiaz
MPILSPKSWPLAIKLSLTITAVVAAVGFMIGAVIVAQDWKRFQDELGAKALLLSEFVAITTPKAMLRKDYWQLYLSLKNMASRRSDTTGGHEVITAMILDTEGKVMAHLHPADNKMDLPFSPVNRIEEELFQRAMSTRSIIVLSSGGFSKTGFQEGVVPIFSDQKYMGVVRVRLSVAQLYEKAKDSAMIVLALVFCFVILGSGLGIIVSRRIVKPLTAVTQGLEAVGRGEMADFTPIPINERDEIGNLSVTFNQIMAELAEKKMLEEEIAMSEKLVALGRITAGVAHEVNNPLAGLLNCIDTLRKHPDDKKLIDRYLPVIDQGLHRIKDIVHSLLVGLKIEESHETMSIQHIDKLHDLIKAEIGERNIDIIWENRTNKDLHIPGKIEQIVCNLLKNAVEILPQGGRVVFCMHQNGPQLVIEVSDNGPGIPSNIRNQLFDPFFTTKTNGTGLGLWVVYRLVQSMEGIIEVMSDEDQGTTFHVSVPVITMKAA